jgi:hypothetical protein
MSSYLRQIADALAAGLQAVSWSIPSTTVERKNWATIDLDAMADPVIFVTPGSAEVSRISRNVSQIDYEVSVFIGRHVQSDAEVDGMLDLADEALLQVRSHDWTEAVVWPEGVTSPITVTIELNPDDALSERNAWRAVITATYRVFSADQLPE